MNDADEGGMGGLAGNRWGSDYLKGARFDVIAKRFVQNLCTRVAVLDSAHLSDVVVVFHQQQLKEIC